MIIWNVLYIYVSRDRTGTIPTIKIIKMKKYLLLASILPQATLLIAQIEKTSYEDKVVQLNYTYEKYNSIELNGKIYDQYEVDFTFNNISRKYIHNPSICRIGFTTGIQHPSSSSEIDFSERGEIRGYIEYNDGTALPEDLNSPIEEDKYGRVTTRYIIEKGTTNRCTKYVLVEQGKDIGKPSYSVEFNNSFPIIVSGSDELIETWINRQGNGTSLKNVSSWPMVIRSLHEGRTECGNAQPIGNKGEEALHKILPADVKAALRKSLNEKISVLKKYFEQAGYKIQSEGDGTLSYPNNDTKSAYIVDFSIFKLHFDNEDGGVGILTVGESGDTKLGALLESFEIGGVGDGPGENGEPAWNDRFFLD